MLVKVQYQARCKFVKLLRDRTFQDFLNEVKSKFGLATKAALQVFDTDTNVEEDILHELIEVSPYLCQTVRCSEENITAGLSDEFSPTRSSTPAHALILFQCQLTMKTTERAVQNQTAIWSATLSTDAENSEREFAMLFNAETSIMFPKRWETAFKQNIINEAKSITSTAEMRCLLNAAGGQESENDWDSDMSSVLLLLHLLPPLRKKTFQQRLLTDLCISISLAPVLKAFSVGGRTTRHFFWDQEGSRAGLTTFTSL
ncbi:uncharacterized protein LOC120473756 [Pimephales promelas]|uniref:uncharacterized protein LOC120473756 n=1 Tax=Pimephales promelas TaxID=90988 RepID=UPI001955BEDF|nr:uncharacterized protein LOC120473756 [Pimephales promelas]XP_039519680.1 uncharacterized protein LOC120473756 [Pimephales promelas]